MLKHKNGFTLLELILSISLIFLLSSTLFLQLRPVENKKRARDTSRLASILEIERVVNEYFLDMGKYPGDENVLYVSNTPNWIPVPNMNEYISRIPVDPGDKLFYYTHNNNSYEINAVLEFSLDLMQNDNGDNSLRYEVGNNLGLINNN